MHGKLQQVVRIYGIRNCDSMKKAFVWLADHAVVCDFVDYRQAAPTAAQLADAEYGPLDQAQVAAMLADERAVTFDGYRRTELESFAPLAAPQINSNKATLVGASGRMWYDERYMGTFEATLVKQREGWRIVDIAIVVPPTKPRP